MLIEIGSEVVRFALPTKSDDKVSIGFKLSEELRFSFRTFSLDKFTMEDKHGSRGAARAAKSLRWRV